MDRPPSPDLHAKQGLHYNKLRAPVRTYVDNLRAQVYEVFKKYDVTNMTEFIAKMKKVEITDRQQVIKLMGAIEMAYHENETPGPSIEDARDILGEKNVLGPEEIKNCFGFKPDEVPVIQFSKADLERAKELNEFLILRIDKTPEGKPLSLQTINNLLETKWRAKGKGAILDTSNRWKNLMGNVRYINESVRLGWALVSKELIDESTQVNHFEQMNNLIGYLEQKVFKDRNLPEVYQQAIQEFKTQHDVLALFLSSNWPGYAKRQSTLEITNLCRSMDQEIVYDLALYYDVNNIHLMPNVYTWSSSLTYHGSMVGVGDFDSDGVICRDWGPDNVFGNIGTMFSRRV